MNRTMSTSAALWLVVLSLALLVGPAHALKVYVNPSIQTSNYSPDGAYQEGSNMNDVASRVVAKCQARGFEVRNSAWMDLGSACADSNAWGADCFVALHTDATGGGWSSAHGTRAFYHQSSSGWHDDRNIAFAAAIANRMTARLAAYGRGYNLGTQGDYPWLGWNMYAIAPWNTYAMPATLIEGLYHTNWDDVYGALLVAGGRDAYAQGVFEGICDYYGLPYGGSKPTPSVFTNPDGTLEIFCRAADSSVWHCWQTSPNGPFSTWASLGGTSVVSDIAVAKNLDGRPQLFCRGGNGSQLWTQYRDSNGVWSGWLLIGGTTVKDTPDACPNADGRIQVVVRGGAAGTEAWTCYQTANNTNSWSALQGAGSAQDYTGAPSIVRVPDGRIQFHFPTNAKACKGAFETAANGTTWATYSLGGTTVLSNTEAIINQDGRQQVFCRGGYGADMYTSYQTSPGGNWQPWVYMGWNGATGNPGACKNQDGRLQLLIRGGTGGTQLWTSSQVAANSNTWNSFASLGGSSVASDPAAGVSADGRMFGFIVSTDGTVWSVNQTAANSTTWTTFARIGDSVSRF